ncbi:MULTISPECIES: L-seryl-tRNA(Sec) kinase [unclassified Methanopyrus]|uniref:L-seryl-tRNA(Sec) kinase n=1 Tax=Methanopyrus sp. SNP6 TaxID=1937005 RepID=UPI001439759E|nr:L-seryl-tRNA(Sec) kinase [Methanopyrus sp. SNP6]
MRLLILTGPPGSGKTCFAQGLARELRQEGWRVAHVEADTLRGFLWDEFDPKLEQVARKLFLKSVETCLDAELDLVVADDTNYYSSMRRELALLAMERRVPWGIVYLRVDLDTCLRRNRERGEPIPEEVVRRIYEKFEPPEPDRWWERATLVLDDSRVSDEVLEFVESGLRVEKPKKRRRRADASSVNEVDVRTRRVMGELMRRLSETGAATQELGRKLSELRREIVSSVEDPEKAVREFRRRAEEVIRECLNGDG